MERFHRSMVPGTAEGGAWHRFLLRPDLGQLDDRRGRQAHVLDADPFALAVRVVAAREDVRRRQAISVRAEPSVPPRIDVRLGSSPTRRQPPRGSRRSRMPVEVSRMLRYWMRASTSIEHRSSVAATSRASPRRNSTCSSSWSFSKSRDDEPKLHLGRVARDHNGVDVAFAVLGRLRRARVLRQLLDDRRGELDRVDELALRPAGMDRPAADVHAHLCARERLALHLSRGRTVDRVRAATPKVSTGKWMTPRPTSSSGLNATFTGPCGSSGCARRYATAAMISATPDLSSARGASCRRS